MNAIDGHPTPSRQAGSSFDGDLQLSAPWLRNVDSTHLWTHWHTKEPHSNPFLDRVVTRELGAESDRAPSSMLWATMTAAISVSFDVPGRHECQRCDGQRAPWSIETIAKEAVLTGDALDLKEFQSQQRHHGTELHSAFFRCHSGFVVLHPSRRYLDKAMQIQGGKGREFHAVRML